MNITRQAPVVGKVKLQISWQRELVPIMVVLWGLLNQVRAQLGFERPIVFPWPFDPNWIGEFFFTYLRASLIWWIAFFGIAFVLRIVYLTQESKTSWTWWFVGMSAVWTIIIVPWFFKVVLPF